MGQTKWKGAITAFVLGGALLLGGNTAGAEPSQDGMWAFREAYTSIVPDNRVFRESINFFGPEFHADLNCQGQMLRDGALRLAGDLEWGYTDKKTGETTQLALPFYVEQNKADMVYYGQYNGQWCKLTLPGISPQLASVLKTTDVQAMEENMDVVKAVEVLQETDKQRVMKIFLDGDKVAALVEKYCAQDNPRLTPEKQQRHREMVQRLERACKATNLQVVWTVDKTKWQTVTVALNLTEFMRNYAQGILKESAEGKIKLSDNEQEFLSALGYYSELHAYTTYMDTAPERLAVPKDVRKSALELNIFKGMQAEVAASAEK